MNIMELFDNTTAFFNHCISELMLCLTPYEQVIHKMNVPTVELRWPRKLTVQSQFQRDLLKSQDLRNSDKFTREFIVNNYPPKWR